MALLVAWVLFVGVLTAREMMWRADSRRLVGGLKAEHARALWRARRK